MKAKKVNEQNFEQGQDPKRAMNIGKGRELDMMAGIDAFTHWLYYVDAKDMVEKAFDGWQHIQDKLHGYAMDSGYLDAKALMKFVRDLDTGNQRKLYKYIIENHSDKW